MASGERGVARGLLAYALDKRKKDNELEGSELCERFVVLQVLFKSREEFDNRVNGNANGDVCHN